MIRTDSPTDTFTLRRTRRNALVAMLVPSIVVRRDVDDQDLIPLADDPVDQAVLLTESGRTVAPPLSPGALRRETP